MGYQHKQDGESLESNTKNTGHPAQRDTHAAHHFRMRLLCDHRPVSSAGRGRAASSAGCGTRRTTRLLDFIFRALENPPEASRTCRKRPRHVERVRWLRSVSESLGRTGQSERIRGGEPERSRGRTYTPRTYNPKKHANGACTGRTARMESWASRKSVSSTMDKVSFTLRTRWTGSPNSFATCGLTKERIQLTSSKPFPPMAAEILECQLDLGHGACIR